MPELPEVEHLRQTLDPILIGSTVAGLMIRRREIILGRDGQHLPRFRLKQGLLGDARLIETRRHGKQLALIAEDGRALCLGLGMTGQMWYIPVGRWLPHRDHVHVIWRIESPHMSGRLAFRDVRRFGRLRCFESVEDLNSHHWSRLGPDALTVSSSQLVLAMRRTASPIKAALLNQALIAGIGNIYADEALFLAGIHPLSPARLVEETRLLTLRETIIQVLSAAITNGGTTLRNYVDARGEPGRNSRHLNVYGRKSGLCNRCSTPLKSIRIQQRSTVFCPSCQPAQTLSFPNSPPVIHIEDNEVVKDRFCQSGPDRSRRLNASERRRGREYKTHLLR